jgi:uncharacterized protein (TIGR02757 family)
MRSRQKTFRVKPSALETLYCTFNNKSYVHPDPLEHLYKYKDIKDREIAGIVVASLAYGRVQSILKKTAIMLDIMGDSPYEFIRSTPAEYICSMCKGFKHRLVTGAEIAKLLLNIQKVLTLYGSLNACFVSYISKSDENVLNALCKFANIVGEQTPHLIPDPSRGSACKRLNLYLRWMVRQDNVDPGGWYGITPAMLIVPLDVHMARISYLLGFTKRKTPDMAMALEITQSLKAFDKSDPVKYDFALTRYGIQKGLSIKNLLRELKTEGSLQREAII